MCVAIKIKIFLIALFLLILILYLIMMMMTLWLSPCWICIAIRGSVSLMVTLASKERVSFMMLLIVLTVWSVLERLYRSTLTMLTR